MCRHIILIFDWSSNYTYICYDICDSCLSCQNMMRFHLRLFLLLLLHSYSFIFFCYARSHWVLLLATKQPKIKSYQSIFGFSPFICWNWASTSIHSSINKQINNLTRSDSSLKYRYRIKTIRSVSQNWTYNENVSFQIVCRSSWFEEEKKNCVCWWWRHFSRLKPIDG